MRNEVTMEKSVWKLKFKFKFKVEGLRFKVKKIISNDKRTLFVLICEISVKCILLTYHPALPTTSLFQSSLLSLRLRSATTDHSQLESLNLGLATSIKDFSTAPSTHFDFAQWPTLRVTSRNDNEPHWCQFVKFVSTAHWIFAIKPSLFSIVFSLLSCDSWLLVPH